MRYIFGASSLGSNFHYVPTSLKEVIITGTSIGEYAFYGCSGLTSVTIPNSVTSIGGSAFYGCSGLTAVYITDLAAWCGIKFNGYDSNPLYYAHNLYLNGELVTDLVIPDSVTSIGEDAFRNCSGLTSVTIPDSVTSIGRYAFYGCSSLESITLPFVGAAKDGTEDTHFGYIFGASHYSSNEDYVPASLKEVIITGGTSIGSNAFYGCSGLTYVNIGNGVTSIGSYAFYGCSSLTSVTIPDSVTSIGRDAFSGCSSLTSITIPNSVTSIGSYAFDGCTAEIIWGDDPGITEIGNYAFSGYQGTSITIPDTVTSIGERAFYGCSGLTSVTIPDSVTSIGEYAFEDCSGLTSVTIGNGVTSIGWYAFDGCSGLTAVHITDIAAWCEIDFSYSSSNPLYYANDLYLNGELVTDLVIPDSVTSIGRYAFYGCSSLESITLPFVGATKDGTSNTHFGYIFGGNSYVPDSLKEVIITGGTSIGSSAFYNCSSLTSVTIPDGVTSIGSSAFYNCSSLTSITIPDSVTSIGGEAFFGCSGLTAVYITDIAAWCGIDFGVSASNPLYYAHNLYLNGELVTDLVIPDGVTSIGSYAFSGCDSLTSVIIPDSVTSIGYGAFEGCSSLTSVTIPDSVTSIGAEAFYGCDGLTSVIFEETAGWYRASSMAATIGSLSSSSLADPATAAEWLTSTYCDDYWKRNV